MSSLHLESCKIGWRAGGFYKKKNKEEKNRKYLTGWAHTVDLAWGEKEQEIRIELRAGLVFGDWLTGYTAFLVK